MIRKIMTFTKNKFLFFITIVMLLIFNAYISSSIHQKTTITSTFHTEKPFAKPILSPFAVLQQETHILRIEPNPFTRFVIKIISSLKSPRFHLSLFNLSSLCRSACPSNRLYPKFLVLECSYQFLRLSILKSQSHPPTLFF